MDRDQHRFWDKVDKSGDCWEWTAYKNQDGYGKFWSDGAIPAHRHSFRLANGHLPVVVRHTCDNPGCVNPSHLESGTQTDNVRDRGERGRQAKGERHGHSKLTEKMVIYIRQNPLGLTQQELATVAGTERSTVGRAQRGDTWGPII